MSYTLTQVIFAVSRQGVALSADTAGYLVLAAAEQVLDGRAVGDEHVTLESSGGLTVSRQTSGPDTPAPLLLGNRLGRLLAAASGENLRLVAAAREPAPGIDGFVGQLREALLPLNRSAAQRALKRLHRNIEALGEAALSRAPSLSEPSPVAELGCLDVALESAGGSGVTRSPTPTLAIPVVAPRGTAVDVTNEHTVRVLLQTPVVDVAFAPRSGGALSDVASEAAVSIAPVETVAPERRPILVLDPSEDLLSSGSARDETRRLGSLGLEPGRQRFAPPAKPETVPAQATPRLWLAVQTPGHLPSLIEVEVEQEDPEVVLLEESNGPDDAEALHAGCLISLEESLPVPEVDEVPRWLVDETTISDAIPVALGVELGEEPSDDLEDSVPPLTVGAGADDETIAVVMTQGLGAPKQPGNEAAVQVSRDAGLGTIRGRRSDVRELVSAFAVQPVQTEEQLLSALRRTVDAQGTPLPPRAKAAGAK